MWCVMIMVASWGRQCRLLILLDCERSVDRNRNTFRKQRNSNKDCNITSWKKAMWKWCKVNVNIERLNMCANILSVIMFCVSWCSVSQPSCCWAPLRSCGSQRACCWWVWLMVSSPSKGHIWPATGRWASRRAGESSGPSSSLRWHVHIN